MPTTILTQATAARNLPLAGIDVGSKHLDLHIIVGEKHMPRRFQNSKEGRGKLIRFVKQHQVTRIVMEATGAYHRAIARSLEASGIHADVRNPAQIKHFALAKGWIEKNDQIDAKHIAIIASMIDPGPRYIHCTTRERLRALVTLREQFVGMRVALKNQFHAADVSSGEQPDEFVEAASMATLNHIKDQIKCIEAEILALIESDPELLAKYELMLSVQGVGKVTAATLLAEFPELETANRKQLAKLAGLAPIISQSGTSKGKASIKGGRSSIRRILYCSAKVAGRHQPTLKAFMEKRIAAGHSRKQATVACAHKLLRMLSAILKTKTPCRESAATAAATRSKNAAAPGSAAARRSAGASAVAPAAASPALAASAT